ncbi:MAG: hypothetical protein GF421_00795 [Candidatus Aminicenantes bacterium]|nr:hypothetical protein [Candidatus Aminicenantes bacterium]
MNSSGRDNMAFKNKSQYLSLILIPVLFLHTASWGQNKDQIENVKLPPGWVIQKTITVPEDMLETFSQRLGGEMTSAVNYILDVDGVMLRVNVAEGKTKEDAQKIYQAFFALHKKEEECLLKGKKVFEFISGSFQLIEMARSLFSGEAGITEDMMKVLDQVIWEANITAAPVKKADYSSSNDMFVRLRAHTENPQDEKICSQINSLKNRFTFSNVIHLRYETPPWGTPEYSIPGAEKTGQRGDIVTFQVHDPQNKLGIPCIEIKALIPVKESSFYSPEYKINKSKLTAPNPYWPTENKKIRQILEKIVQNEMTPVEKAKAVHSWIQKNLKFGREKIGSRYGVIQAINQGFGRCWDFCDVFVTLCRAAQIPSRQIMGWIYGKSGHVWAQVYIPEKGWFPMDPSTPSSLVTTDYVPFFISEDGELPVIYWTEPTLRMMNKKE